MSIEILAIIAVLGAGIWAIRVIYHVEREANDAKHRAKRLQRACEGYANGILNGDFDAVKRDIKRKRIF